MADIAVIVAFHNEERYLEECLQSLVGQVEANWRLYLIDDASTDGSSKIAQEFADRHGESVCFARVVRRSGKAHCVSLAETMIKESYVTFLDADDRILPRALVTAKNALDRAPKREVAITGSRIIDSNGSHVNDWRWNADPYSKKSLRAGRVSPGLMMVRTAAYKDAGGIDIDFVRGHMYELRLRLARRGPFVLIPEALYSYRVHDRQNSRENRDEQVAYIEKARKKHKDVK